MQSGAALLDVLVIVESAAGSLRQSRVGSPTGHRVGNGRARAAIDVLDPSTQGQAPGRERKGPRAASTSRRQ